MRMKKIRFLLVTLVALLAGVSSVAGKTVYIQPNDWSQASAVISLNVWVDGSGGNTWATLTEVETGILKATFDDSFDKMAILRANSGYGNKWKSEDGTNVWNQSADIDIVDGKLYSINSGSWDGAAVGSGITLSDYTEPAAAGYTVDFNTAINTSSHDFAVAPKWRHIVQDNEGYYVSYKWDAAYGYGGTGGLMVNTQRVGASYYDMANVYDLLVTPKVSGTIKFKVKATSSVSSSSNYNAYVQLWSVNATGTEKDSQLKEFKTEIPGYNNSSNSEWVELTYDLGTTPQRIGIRAQYVYIDDFTADAIDDTPEAALVVSSVMSSGGQTGTDGTNPIFEQQPDGNMKVILKVTLTNTGDVDFVAGTTANYTLTPAQASSTSGTKTYYDDASIAIPEDLAAGETKTFDVEFSVPYSSGWKYWYVREDVTGTTSSTYRYATSVAYQSNFVIRESGSTSTSSLSAQNWGTITTSTTKDYEIANTGTAPLTIVGYSAPTGFTMGGIDPTALPDGVTLDINTMSLTIAGGKSLPFTVTQEATTQGTYTGILTVVYKNYGSDTNTDYTLEFTAKVIGANTWVAEFDNTTSTPKYPGGSIAENGINSDYSYQNGSYNNWLLGRSQTSYANGNNKFITPKLHANANDKLAFDVKRGESSSATYNVKVYVSTDRKNWGEPVFTMTASDMTSSFQTKEISFADAGDYYIAFALYGVCLDNLVGLEKVDVAHDLYIKEVTWPDATVNSGASISSKPKVVVIPLTDEAASNYTVKYMYGETVLAEATPVALTASANSSKDFSFTWTPTVANTTTYNGTKVVFDFGGGVTFETESFDLTVVNEPKFHFVKTLPSSKWNEPSDYTTPITFGKTNTADVQTFYINNWGSARLQVKSIVMPTGFTTSVSAPLTVAAFNGETDGIAAASQALDITFSATEAGLYSGDMVITYVDGTGADATFTLAISGTKLDPDKFYATFGTSSDASNYPAGSLVQANVSIITPSTDNGALSCSSSTKNLFITPLLTSVGETMLFDARQRSSYYTGSVKVYSVSDHIAAANTTNDEEFAALNPTLLGEFSMSSTNFATYSFEVPAGDSYLAFKIQDAYVDEIYGLAVADVAHELQIASSNIPTEGMQNYSSTATVNVLNFGVATDKVTVTAYINGVAVATSAETEVAMNHKLSDAGTEVSVTYMSNLAGTFPVYLEVKAGDVVLKTDPVDVEFLAEVATAEGIQVGTRTSTGRDFGFVDWYNNDGSGTRYTDILYTAAKISAAGIKAGDKITAITFKGSNSAKSFKAEVTSWVGTSTGDITYGSPDKSSMEQVTVYTGTVDFPANVESVINLANPIVWDGISDIRVYTEAAGQGNGNWMSVQYPYDNELTMSFNGTTKSGTVAYFTLAAQSATLAGKVQTSAGQEIVDAEVVLKASNGVQYSGVTDTEGNYSINVIQAGLDFTATVEAAGYLKREFALNMGGASATQNVTLFKQIGLVGTFPGFPAFDSEGSDLVMTQSADDPNIFTYEVKNVALDGTTYEYKLRADGKWATALADGYELPSSGNNNWGFGTKMYPAGTYNLTFTADMTNHTLTLVPVLQLTLENSMATALDYENAPADVTIGRTLKKGWNAIVLPFELDADEITAAFGTEAEVAEFDGDVVNGENVSITFTKSYVIEANVPYLLYLDAVPAAENLKFEGKTVTFAEAKVGGNAFNFVGIYKDGSVAAGDFIVADGKFYQANGGNGINAYRSYLQKKGTGARTINFYIDDEMVGEFSDTTTGINGIAAEKNADGLYNLSGQKVNNSSRKGVYIQNGKKVVVGRR